MDHIQPTLNEPAPQPDQQPNPQPQSPSPTLKKNRFKSLDTLRGFALLGILLPNMWQFAWPMQAFKDATIISDSAANTLALNITWIGFDSKFRFLFAMLFGAGVIVYARKYDRPDLEHKTRIYTGAPLWYLRCGLLLTFGLIHAYLFWYGDILTMYAIAGLTILWWIRRFPIKLQLTLGIISYIIGLTLMAGLTYLLTFETQSQEQPMFMSPESQIAAYQGSWLDGFLQRAITTLVIQLIYMALYMATLWGIMTFGMVLMRTKVLEGAKSTRWYLISAAISLSIGIPLTWAWFNWQAGAADLPDAHKQFRHIFVEPAGLPLALGYGAIIIALTKSSTFNFITTPLAAVGRMALTNYFLHTLLCTTFFYGHGFGYYAKIEFPNLYLVVLTVWTINIIFSMLWLKHFTMGPLEWLWRSLTYRKLVPIRA